jgi:hypothetical protein
MGCDFVINEHKIVRFLMQCNPTCGGFVCDLGAVKKRLVVTHLKAPFEFRFIEMQDNILDIFFIKLFLLKNTEIYNLSIYRGKIEQQALDVVFCVNFLQFVSLKIS